MVLCLTHSNDFYTIDIVQQHLQRLGMSSFRFNTDEFTNSRFTYSLLNDIEKNVVTINDQTINTAQISAVWYRKSWEMKVPAELDPTYKTTFIKEYSTYRQLFFNKLSHVPWMNIMEVDHAVGNDKLKQLTTAKATGLTIPLSIFTNDPAAIRNFFDSCKGNMVVKLHGALSKSMDGRAAFFPTTRITKESLEHIDELAYCPMIFQEYIPKAYELRIAYVDGEFFAGKIPNADTEVTDWRTRLENPIQWQSYQLPVDIKDHIHTLMQNLYLSFGAIDMIRHTNGEYVFLEVNPQGEWGMLQRDLAYPIGETIAQKLLTRITHG